MNHEDMAPAAGTATGERAPVGASDRIGSLDFIRGLAVMGILAANIVAFGQPPSAYMFPDAFQVPANDAGGWMWVAQFVLIDGKMRGLFTLLFGAGLYLFMERAWAQGATRWLQARRLFFLLLFGLAHFFFIWFGDILSYYAMCGLVVLLCLRWTAKRQLIVGLTGYVLGSLAYLALMAPLPFVADTPLGDSAGFAEMREDLEKGKADALADDAAEAELISSGDYTAFVAHRFSEHGFDPLANVLLFGLETLPLMLVGVALYRYGFFGNGIDRATMVRWGWIGLVAGALLHLAIALWARAEGFTFYGTLAAFVGFSSLPRLPMVVGLAALLVVYSPAWSGWLGQRITAAGRAAFTNYLGTSVAMLLVFHGWALGLFGKLDRPHLYVVVVLAWLVMLAWSKPWLARYRYGPLEWLWRCLTYGRLFPLQR
ncbi:MAG: DUF418 domain-containing protein [Erythrobacter sp.]